METDTPDEVVDINEDKRKKKPNTSIKQTRLPCSALSLYIKLYSSKKCSKRSKYTTNIIEATKSWLTLSEQEKEHFYDKYKEYQQKHIQIVGNCLQKAELYMKKKKGVQKKNCIEINNGKESKSEINDTNEVELEANKENDSFIDITEHKTEIDEQMFYNEMNQTMMESDTEYNQILSHEPLKKYNPEPAPPSLKSGKELFEIIKLMDKSTDSTWASLPIKEKCNYNRAVILLKHDYIQKYRQYLEHLTQRELFDYYNKTFN